MGTAVPTLTPTVDPLATPTPNPPYAAPALLSPSDGAALEGTASPIVLQWTSISVLGEDEWYEATLFFSSGVVAHKFHTRATVWRVPFDLLMEADGEMSEFRWQVMVVREVQGKDGGVTYEEAGYTSEVRTFVWVKPTPTPTPIPSPTP